MSHKINLLLCCSFIVRWSRYSQHKSLFLKSEAFVHPVGIALDTDASRIQISDPFDVFKDVSTDI